MTLWRIYRWIRRLYALLVLLAAASGIGPGAVKAPPASTPPAVVAPAPSPTPPARHVVGSCATGWGGTGWYATCVVDGRSVTLPGVYGARSLAQQAIRDYRAANT